MLAKLGNDLFTITTCNGLGAAEGAMNGIIIGSDFYALY
jgi:hypothetical protein